MDVSNSCSQMLTVLIVHCHALLFRKVWIQPGAGLADDFLGLVEGFSNNNPEATILLILFVFAVVHSGLAGLRPKGACTSVLAWMGVLALCFYNLC
eukprot:583059-Pelagomonas_calceolata.AAC.1